MLTCAKVQILVFDRNRSHGIAYGLEENHIFVASLAMRISRMFPLPILAVGNS